RRPGGARSRREDHPDRWGSWRWREGKFPPDRKESFRAAVAGGDSARGKEHLVNQHYPDTAALLLQQAPEILRRWDRRVRREIPASRAQAPLVLQNNLGPLLTEVAKALSPTDQPQATIE